MNAQWKQTEGEASNGEDRSEAQPGRAEDATVTEEGLCLQGWNPSGTPHLPAAPARQVLGPVKPPPMTRQVSTSSGTQGRLRPSAQDA